MSKQQRRKGNAKNASSAAAHGYLAQGGATLVGLTPEMNIFEVASSNRLHQVAGIDDEARIVIKKLTKKDCLTREKGLKELMALVSTNSAPSIETCYEHFCGLVPLLSTDGSPAVRMLTMKTISMFLGKLKKAAGKGLKKIIPMVLFSKSDVTNGVAAAASAVIRDSFDADKKSQIIQLFAPKTFEIAASIAQGNHDLCTLIEYDASENRESRISRLETQSLNVFLSYIREIGEDDKLWEENAKKMLENQEFIKKTFAGSKESSKVQILNILYRITDNIDLMISLPPIIPYILATLDSQTFSTECTVSWEGLILLMGNLKFQEKFSLEKRVFPRILNVIRGKGNHWRVLKHFFLPAIVVLLRETKNEKVLKSIIESFPDNLPWKSDISMNSIHCWFSTFCDFVKWIVTSDTVNSDIWSTLQPVTLEMLNQSILIHTAESIESMSSLIFWIIESKFLNSTEISEFTRKIQEKIEENGDEKGGLMMINSLTEPGKLLELTDLHSIFLNSKNSNFQIIRNLANSEEPYFQGVLRKLENLKFLETTGKFEASQSEDIVKLILRILNSESEVLNSRIPNIVVKNDAVCRNLLLQENEKIWETILKKSEISIFQEMINYLHEKRNGKAMAKAVNFLKSKNIQLDTNEAAGNVDFLISTLTHSQNEKIETFEEKSLVLKLFSALFDVDEEPKLEHFQILKGYLKIYVDVEFFRNLFGNGEEFEMERIFEISQRFDRLIGFFESENEQFEISQRILISKNEMDEYLGRTHYLELEALTHSTDANIITRPFCEKLEHLNESDSLKLMKEMGRNALFSLASRYQNPHHQVFGWQVSQLISLFSLRYCLKSLDEELQNLKSEIEKKLKKSNEILEKMSENVIGLNLLVDYGIDVFEKNLIRENENLRKLFEKNGSALEFMEWIFEMRNEEYSFSMFEFKSSSSSDWLANLLFAKNFLQCGAEIFKTENFELRDFALCGIVTVLDNSTDRLIASPHIFEQNSRLESLTALYIEIFAKLSSEIQNSSDLSEHNAEEWNEFYSPTIKTYFIRMFRSVRKDQQPTPIVRSLLKVLFDFTEFPENLPNDDAANREFVPELSEFKYPPFQESCISHAFNLLTSNIEHIQLIGYSIAKLLTPIMFNTENEKALKPQDESEIAVSSSARQKLDLPKMITKSYYNHQNHAHLGTLLLDLSLIPLETSEISTNFGQEKRVAYCDVIDPFLKNAFNSLWLDQPFDFTRSPIHCRIPKSQERDYYLSSDLSASAQFFDKFAARLLFKSITLLPAAIRLFYKSMQNCHMPMFQEAVTKYASRLLIDNELAKVKSAEFTGEMRVRTIPVTGEITAEYTVEETKMKLTIGLPSDYPLSVPTLSLDKAIVKSDRAKKWLLQLNAYLFHQNGAILEGIEMWKRNVDKGVEGVEDCTICMMTVHQQTHQLPKNKCKQCKNKFHSHCLYKWFETSNQTTCPLCRTNFA